MSRRVIFLDIDGVLAAFSRKDPMKLDRACCAILVEIVRRCGFCPVIDRADEGKCRIPCSVCDRAPPRVAEEWS